MDIARLGFQIDSRAAAAAAKNLDQMTAAAGRAQTGTQRMAQQVNSELARVNSTLRSFAGGLAAAFSVAALAQFGRGLARVADEYANIQGRLRLVTQTQEQLGRVTQEVFAISQRTYASMDATATLVARTTRALVSNGAAQDVALQKSLQMSEALNNAFLVSGASAAEASNAIIQLSQGLAAGALRGEEFNSIAEQGPRIMQALADYLGVTTGELRAMAAEGRITADVVQNALLSSFERLSDEAAQMPLTIGRSMQQLSNSFAMLIGQLDQASQGSAGIAGAIQTLARAIDILGPQLAQLVNLWATQDAEQGNATDSAQRLAETMKTVVTGLLLAKNAIDVLVSGFRFMIGIATAAASEIINSFSEVAQLPQIIQRVMNPTTMLQGLGEFNALIDRNAGAIGRFASEADRLAAQFGAEFNTNVQDVANAFAFLESGADGAADGVKRTADAGVEFVAAAAGMTGGAKRAADQMQRLAAIQRAGEGAKFLATTRQLAAQLQGPLAVAMQRHRDAMDEINRLQFEGAISTQEAIDAMAVYEQELQRAIEEIEAMGEEAQWMQGILEQFGETRFDALVAEIERVSEAMKQALTPDQRKAMLNYMNELQTAAGEYRQQGLETMVGAAQNVLGSIQKLSKEGSDAYKAMEVASQALNVVLAIGAVLNQGKGDPYSAPARMAAMAVAVAGLVGSIGANFGGSNGFTDTAAERQATQGRGTVLGDAEAQSRSIANATEITADATSQLVGINRGMLNALQQLQGGIASAGGMLARGAGQAGFTEIGGSFRFADNFLGGALSFAPLDPLNLLGGSSRITDQGLMIGGGGLGDVGIQAYQEQQYRRWRFGSRRTREELVPVADDFAAQFQLIVDSIADTVRRGAEALGMLPADIEAALEAFRLEEIRISLKDLSAEEQQQELLAVFSQIFDNLAGDVVPFIEQFQRVGEGLGETLVRVATGVQVTREALLRLGFALDEMDPERFAQASEALIDLVGGIDEFISGMNTFMRAFAPDSHIFAVAQDELARALEQVGLTIPPTRDAMWELMQSLDATTESGRNQIATLLRLAGVADTYYSLLEDGADDELQARIEHLEELRDAQRAYYDFAEGIAEQFAREFGSDLNTSLIQIERQYRDNIRTAGELARAAGMAGAAEQDLARIELIAARQRVEAIRLTEQSARELAGELGLTELSALEMQIADLESAAQGMQGAVGGVSDAFDAAAQRARETMDLLLGDLSPLRDREKLDLALQGLREGTVSADTVLQIGRRLFASGADYRQLFDQVMAINAARPLDTGSDVGGPAGTGISPELERLMARRDEILGQQAAQQARANALELVEQIAELASVQALTFEEVAASLGIDLAGLADILQVDSDTLAEMLQRQADEAAEQRDAVLGVPERFADAVAPIEEELEQLREQVAELIAVTQQVATNTARTADSSEEQTETVRQRALFVTAGQPRSNRFVGNGEIFIE